MVGLNIKMPQNCKECFAYCPNFYGQGYCDLLKGKLIYDRDRFNKRDDDCPLIELEYPCNALQGSNSNEN